MSMKCTCMTKTPKIEHHAADCLYRIAFEKGGTMKLSNRYCKHGTPLDKYCPECDKEDREPRKKEFKPKEGDRILVGISKDRIDNEITYLYTDKHGRFICVHPACEKKYRVGDECYAVQVWPSAKPLPPKIPEFIDGDPIIVWDEKSNYYIRIVHKITGSEVICYCSGAMAGPLSPPWQNYKPFPGYDYGGRDVWGSEDKK
jgi:hypothetical protein